MRKRLRWLKDKLGWSLSYPTGKNASFLLPLGIFFSHSLCVCPWAVILGDWRGSGDRNCEGEKKQKCGGKRGRGGECQCINMQHMSVFSLSGTSPSLSLSLHCPGQLCHQHTPVRERIIANWECLCVNINVYITCMCLCVSRVCVSVWI